LTRISVVTPSYNQGRYIERTIRSVLDQGYPDLEYFIFDGGSTDESVEVIRRYADRVTHWQSEKDNGQSDAVNRGWRRATGDIIGWLNSDDVYCPGALNFVQEFFASHPELDVLYGGGELIDENDRRVTTERVSDFSLERLLEEHFIPQPSMFFRRRVLDAGLFLDESYRCHMDREFILRMAVAGFRFFRCEPVLSQSRLQAERKSETLIVSTREVNCCDREFVRIYEVLCRDAEFRNRYGRSVARGILNRCEARYAQFDPTAVRFLAAQVLRLPYEELHPRARILSFNSYLHPRLLVGLRAAKKALRTS